MPTIQPSTGGCCASRAAVRDVVLAGLDGEGPDLEVQPLRAGFGRVVHRCERRDVLGVGRGRVGGGRRVLRGLGRSRRPSAARRGRARNEREAERAKSYGHDAEASHVGHGGTIASVRTRAQSEAGAVQPAVRRVLVQREGARRARASGPAPRGSRGGSPAPRTPGGSRAGCRRPRRGAGTPRVARRRRPRTGPGSRSRRGGRSGSSTPLRARARRRRRRACAAGTTTTRPAALNVSPTSRRCAGTVSATTSCTARCQPGRPRSWTTTSAGSIDHRRRAGAARAARRRRSPRARARCRVVRRDLDRARRAGGTPRSRVRRTRRRATSAAAADVDVAGEEHDRGLDAVGARDRRDGRPVRARAGRAARRRRGTPRRAA